MRSILDYRASDNFSVYGFIFGNNAQILNGH